MELLRSVTIGQYLPGNSLVHRLDPRTKIVATAALIGWMFAVNQLQGFFGVGLFVALLLAASRVPLRYVLMGLRPVALLLVFTVMVHIFWTDGRTIFALGPVRATYEGLEQAVFLSLRLILLVVGSSLLTLTTSPIELTDGLERLLSPLRRIGVPAHELAMMMTIALRFIPTLLEEAERIMKAQTARGADFESGNLLRRARALIPLLVPLFVGAFRRADELAVAMEARCYRGGEGRTKLHPLQLTWFDWAAMVCAILVATLATFLSRRLL